MRFLIVEDQLVDEQGHHLSYLASIVAGAKAQGVQVEIASRIGSTLLVTSTLPALPVLHDTSGLAGRGIGAIKNSWMRKAALAANIVRNAWTIRRLLVRGGPYDELLCLSAALPQLAMLALVRLGFPRISQQMAALFIDYPKLGEQPNLRMRLLRWMVRTMGPNLCVLATTHYARRSWEQMLNMPVHYVVHPVELLRKQSAVAGGELSVSEAGVRAGTMKDTNGHEKEGMRLATDSADEHGWGKAGPCLDTPSGAEFSEPVKSELARGFENTSLNRPAICPAASPATASSMAKPLIFGFYGFARHEQGVDVLMQALELLHREGNLNAEFRILWPEPFRMPDGSWRDRGQFSHLAPVVHFFERSFTPDQYLKVLAASDWVVLPYRWASYAGRISRISIEACVLGIPVIYTKKTDADEVVSNYGAGIAVPEENPQALAGAIRVAIRDNDRFRRTAKERRPLAKEFFSGRSFINQLCSAVSDEKKYEV
jgi:glycosyltransferase involved in cell wall biosynthesis